MDKVYTTILYYVNYIVCRVVHRKYRKLQLVSYVKFKVKASSGGVVLGPMKYFQPVFCRADYSTHFEGPRYA